MRTIETTNYNRGPKFIHQAEKLSSYLKGLSEQDIATVMHVSPTLASKTTELIGSWNVGHQNSIAMDCFSGDIYSGLQAATLSDKDREYADQVLWILSGLYGYLRPLDTIAPYRLEMGYKFPNSKFKDLYAYWGDAIAKQVPKTALVINLSSVEYSKVITDYIDDSRIITPTFLSISPKTGEPIFTAVHAKIARGAFARWIIKNRIQNPSRFKEFNELGYIYDGVLSEPNKPIFICKEFGGLGLSVRLIK